LVSVDDEVEASFALGAAFAGAAKPATARMPVMRSVAATFFIRCPFVVR